MALHREIYWVGRQWAVTGYGMQAVDQKLQGKFDIEAARLWEDGLSESLNAGGWLNGEDFAKALSVARGRYPRPPQETAPPEPLQEATPPEPLRESVLRLRDGVPVEPPKAPPQQFSMLVIGWPAKFVSQWRVRVR